jgi:hypothetical protein
MAVAPGATDTTELTVHAGVALAVTVEADGLGQSQDGAFQPVAADKDTSPYSARSTITFTPASFQMQPGGSQKIAVTVGVPKDAGEGSRYAILKITGIPASGAQNVGIGVQLGVTSVVALASTTQTRLGAISDLAVAKALPGQPLPVTGLLKNTGDSHYGATPNQIYTLATLQNANGDLLSTERATLTGNSIIPSFARKFSLAMSLSHPLSDGRYHLEVEAGLQDGTILDRSALDFELAGQSIQGATSAPAHGLAVPGGGSDSSYLLILGILFGALMSALVVGVFVLRDRKRAPRRVA